MVANREAGMGYLTRAILPADEAMPEIHELLDLDGRRHL